jgi:hypothetical protein
LYYNKYQPDSFVFYSGRNVSLDWWNSNSHKGCFYGGNLYSNDYRSDKRMYRNGFFCYWSKYYRSGSTGS